MISNQPTNTNTSAAADTGSDSTDSTKPPLNNANSVPANFGSSSVAASSSAIPAKSPNPISGSDSDSSIIRRKSTISFNEPAHIHATLSERLHRGSTPRTSISLHRDGPGGASFIVGSGQSGGSMQSAPGSSGPSTGPTSTPPSGISSPQPVSRNASVSSDRGSSISGPSDFHHSHPSAFIPHTNQNMTSSATSDASQSSHSAAPPPSGHIPHHNLHRVDPSDSDYTSGDDHRIHILLAVTGSVATIKIGLIISKLKKIYGDQAVIQLIVTSAAEHFLNGVKIPPDVKIWHDSDEWTSRRGVAEAVLHVRLRRWADILLIAPLSANTLAKIANGICDNLVSSVARSWNPLTPVIVAPAMNTHMYTNPMTKKHLELIKEEFPWFEVLKPVEKVLVCGDIGMGGMREWTDVVEQLVNRLGLPSLSEGEENEEDDNDNDNDNDNENENDHDNDEEEKDHRPGTADSAASVHSLDVDVDL